MTTASEIITAAYRETNLVPLVSTPNANQIAEALARLNPIVLAVLGGDAGEELSDLNIGGAYDQSTRISTYVSENTRLVLNLTAARSFNLHPRPYEGQRLAVVDAGANLATYNLTLSGYGRTIEGVATLTLSTNSEARQWLYRADTANWTRFTALLAGDTMPLPTEYDDYFITMLAMRLNPRYGQQLADATVKVMDDTRAAIQARYRRPRDMQDAGTLGLMGQTPWGGPLSEQWLLR